MDDVAVSRWVQEFLSADSIASPFVENLKARARSSTIEPEHSMMGLAAAMIVRYEVALLRIEGLIDSEAGEPLDDAIRYAREALNNPPLRRLNRIPPLSNERDIAAIADELRWMLEQSVQGRHIDPLRLVDTLPTVIDFLPPAKQANPLPTEGMEEAKLDPKALDRALAAWLTFKDEDITTHLGRAIAAYIAATPSSHRVEARNAVIEECAKVVDAAEAEWFAQYQATLHPAKQANILAKRNAALKLADAIRALRTEERHK